MAKIIIEDISPDVVTDNSVRLIMDALRMLGYTKPLLAALEKRIKHNFDIDFNNLSLNLKVPFLAEIL